MITEKIIDRILCGIILLSILLTVFKLAHVIEWSWALVFAPAWIPLALIFLTIIIGYMYIQMKY